VDVDDDEDGDVDVSADVGVDLDDEFLMGFSTKLLRLFALNPFN
jgi:hypothetical protein